MIVLAFCVSISGCMFSFRRFSRYDYHGDYPELYTVAINSILGARGVAHHEGDYDSEITIIDVDDYGRTMFLYFENNAVSTYSIVICQTSDDKCTYSYPDYNFISAEENQFSGLEIEALKELNDWNTELNPGKCDVYEIVRRKHLGPIDETTLLDFYKQVLKGDSYGFRSSLYFLTTDNYGRSIYLGRGRATSNRYVVLLFASDGTYDTERCVMELTDLYSYQDDLKEFKGNNDWNNPYR